MNWRTGYIVFASLLAVFGFAWSILWNILRYTQFMTVSHTTLLTDRWARQVPTLSICHSYPDSMQNATVAEIWKTFPTEKDVIDTEKSVIVSASPDEPKVKKFLMDGYVCFSVQPGIHWLRASETSSVPTVIATLVLKAGVNVNDDKHSLIFMHDRALPSRNSAHVLGPKKGVIGLTYGYQESMLLPEPYDTKCKAYEEGDEYTSHTDCVNKCIRKENSSLLSPDFLVQEPIDLPRGLPVNETKSNR